MLQREGISPDRIELIARRPRLQYLELYHRIDVGLDTFPYNGHTTSLDSYWMGVPVVTLVGQTVVGRAGLSQLTNLRPAGTRSPKRRNNTSRSPRTLPGICRGWPRCAGHCVRGWRRRR